MTGNNVNLTKQDFEALKPYLQDATIFVNGDRVLMSLDDYLVATHHRTEAEREDMLSFSYA